MFHIHQGGTLNTYCGISLNRLHGPCIVDWTEASRSTCPTCSSFFAVTA